MRYAYIALAALSILAGTATPARAQVSIGISVPGVSIGVNIPAYPELVLVPGYPVYYAPRLRANYFFYDGYYWLYHDDRWYFSDWYNGPWEFVEPDRVPLFVLRVPVRYYLAPPPYFSVWYVDAPPLWHVHWGPRWTRYYAGWEHWDHRVVHAPAPQPYYQRHYAGDHYPRGEDRQEIRREHYRYRPHEPDLRQRSQSWTRPSPRLRDTVQQPSRSQFVPRPQTPAAQPALRHGGERREPPVAQPQAHPRGQAQIRRRDEHGDRRGATLMRQRDPGVRAQRQPNRTATERRMAPAQVRERAQRAGNDAHPLRTGPRGHPGDMKMR